jgi:hypothetical protein
VLLSCLSVAGPARALRQGACTLPCAWPRLALVGSVAVAEATDARTSPEPRCPVVLAVAPARTPDPASGQSRPVVVTRSLGSALATLPPWSHSSGGRGSHLPCAPSSSALPLLSLAFGRSLLPRERAPGA